jgi:hypothetical protein
MLPTSGYGPFNSGSGRGESIAAQDQKWRPQSGGDGDWAAPPSTSPQPGAFNWENPYHSQHGKTPSLGLGAGTTYQAYHQPPPMDQSGRLAPGYAGQQQAPVFELQGAETPVPGQMPAEAPGSPVRPLRGAHNYPPPTWQQ